MYTVKPGIQASSVENELRRQEAGQELASRRQEFREALSIKRNINKEAKRQYEETQTLPQIFYKSALFSWIPWTQSDSQRYNSAKVGGVEELKIFPNIKYSVPSFVTEPQWGDRLKEKVLSILFNVIPNVSKTTLSNAYDDIGHKYYEAAFTHSYFEPNEGRNYENLEKIGDSVAKTALISILLSADSSYTIGEHELTIAFNTILSKPEQARVSRELGFPDLLRSTLTSSPGIDIIEDLYESFFGATYSFSEDIQINGQGVVTQLMFYLIEKGHIKMPTERFESDPVSQLTSAFNRYGFGSPVLTVKPIKINKELQYSATISLKDDPKVRELALKVTPIMDVYEAAQLRIEKRPQGIQPKPLASVVAANGIIATGVDPQRSDAISIAWKNALVAFKNYGLIRDVNHFEHLKLNQVFYPDTASAFYEAYDVAAEQGYRNIYVSDPKKIGANYYIVLYGIKYHDTIMSATKDTLFQITIPASEYENYNEGEEKEEIVKGRRDTTYKKFTRVQALNLAYTLYAKHGSTSMVQTQLSLMTEEEDEE